jgi:hypothetical protein
MCQRSLEHAALSPSRFASRFLDDSWYPELESKAYQPFGTRLLESHLAETLPIDEQPHADFETFRLIPGGRFLITTSTNNVIHLWDLGNSGEIMNPFPLATLLGDGWWDMKDTGPTSDGLGIQLFVATEDPDDR